MFKFIFFVFLLKTCQTVYQTFNCNSKNSIFSIKNGELVFFQSESFPKNIVVNNDSSLACFATFKRTDNLPKGLYFAFTNGFLFNFDISDANGGLLAKLKPQSTFRKNSGYYDSTRSSADTFSYFGVGATQLTLSAKTSELYNASWQAFQAVVFAPSDPVQSTNCWLQKQILNLTDPDQIIPIISEDSSKVEEVCQWFFTIPAGSKLKVNCFHWATYGGEFFRVQSNFGETYNFGNEFSKTFSGTNFTISYNRTVHQDSGIGTGIVAFVSFVSSEIPTTSDCIKTETNGKIVRYYNFNQQFGYKPNTQCTKPLPTIGGQVYDLIFSTKFIEKTAETIQLVINNGDINSFYISDGRQYTLEPSTNMYITDVTFISDGSVNSAGFVFDVSPKNCNCANSKIMAPCNGTDTFGVTGDASTNYCSNMDCNFVIWPNPACPDALIFFEAQMNPRYYNNDTLTVFLDKNVITVLNSENDFKMIVESGQNLTLVFKSGQSLNIGFQAWVFFDLWTIPTVIKKTLTDDSPTFAVNLATTATTSVAIKVDLQSIDLLEFFVVHDLPSSYSTALSYIQIYEGSIFIKTVSSLPSSGDSTTPVHYTAGGKTVTIYNPNQQIPVTLFFRSRLSHIQKCPNPNNVYKIGTSYARLAITSNNGLCPVTIVTSGITDMPEIRMTTLQSISAGAVHKFSPDFNMKFPYFTFDDSTASSWNNVIFKGLYNTLFLMNGSVNMDFDMNNQTKYQPLKGIVFSNNFGRPNVQLNTNQLIQIGFVNVTNNFKTKFTPQTLTDGDKIQINQKNNIFNLTSQKQTVTVDSEGFITVFYVAKTGSTTGVLVVYEQNSIATCKQFNFIVIFVFCIVFFSKFFNNYFI